MRHSILIMFSFESVCSEQASKESCKLTKVTKINPRVVS